jgi:hypothetical protein
VPPAWKGEIPDVVCRSGTNVIYLAIHGWRASGVDFSAAAIRSARTQPPIDAPIDLVPDGDR